MTKVHAYLARIKDQEKDVIAVPDGAGRALCVSSDKHWTLTREWDELHIIAPLVEENAEARTAPAVSRADIEKVVADWVDDAPEIVNEVWSLVSGDDPERLREPIGAYLKWVADDEAVARMIEAEKLTGFGKHENTTALAVDDKDIEAVKVEAVNDGKWWLADGALINTCESPNADEARDAAEEYLELAKGAEAVARAIEAKEDSIVVRARELLNLAYPGEYAWTGAFETCRRIAEAEARLEAGDE